MANALLVLNIDFEVSDQHNGALGAFTPRARAEFCEHFPRLEKRRRQFPGTLSGREQQICAIGRAQMSQLRLLLLDEPSAGLPSVIVQQVFSPVERISASGAAQELLASEAIHEAYLGV